MKPDFSKYADALVPVILQDQYSQKVLMLGFMNEEAWNKTKTEKKLLFLAVARTGFGPKAKLPAIIFLSKKY